VFTKTLNPCGIRSHEKIYAGWWWAGGTEPSFEQVHNMSNDVEWSTILGAEPSFEQVHNMNIHLCRTIDNFWSVRMVTRSHVFFSHLEKIVQGSSSARICRTMPETLVAISGIDQFILTHAHCCQRAWKSTQSCRAHAYAWHVRSILRISFFCLDLFFFNDCFCGRCLYIFLK
jgi:hypothetical protein